MKFVNISLIACFLSAVAIEHHDESDEQDDFGGGLPPQLRHVERDMRGKKGGAMPGAKNGRRGDDDDDDDDDDGEDDNATSSPTPSPPSDMFGLSIEPLQVVQGEDVALTFLVKPEIEGLSSVELRFVETGALIGQAVDDGSLSSGDAMAGDGVFTNTFSFVFQEIGLVEFNATAGETLYFETISVVESGSVASSSVSQEVLLDFYDRRVTMSATESLIDIYAALVASPPETVDPESIAIFLDGAPYVSWTTTQGFVEVISPDFPSNFSPFWPPIILGELPYIVTPPEERRQLINSERRLQTPSFLECVSGKEISFFGMDDSNFLSEVAEEAGLPSSSIAKHTSTCGIFNLFCPDDPLSVLKNLHMYDVVSIVSLARKVTYRLGRSPTTTIGLFTDVPVTEADQYEADIAAKRVIAINGYLAVTPAFFEKYTNSFDGGAVYVGGSETVEYSSVFSSKGVGAFFGHDTVWTSADVWVSLLNGGTAGETPCVGSNCVLTTDPSYSFLELCEARPIPKLLVTYTWPLTQRDLDTGTGFLGGQAGFSCSNNPYITFSGDDTSTGGSETATIDLQAALDNGEWDAETGVEVQLKAGWYSPAGGSGPASVSVRFEDGTGASGIKTISPGSQFSCAATCVGNVYISTVPRLRADTSIGQTCGTRPEPPTLPPEEEGPSDCEQGYYDLVSFSTIGLGERAAGAAFALDSPLYAYSVYQILTDINADARRTAVAEYPSSGCHNNECDAFRHAYFNYRITVEFDDLTLVSTGEAVSWAKLFADAHERSSVNEFRERIMDLLNNDTGRRLAASDPQLSKPEAIRVIKAAIGDGLLTLEPIDACVS